MRRLILAIVFLCMATTAARATVYVGAAAGGNRLKQDALGTQFEATDTCWKIYGGFRILKFFGIEAGYNNLGEPDDSAGGLRFEADTKAYDAFAVGVLPLGDFELFGKAGFSRWEIDTRVTGGLPPLVVDHDTGTDKAFGVGVAYKFAAILAIRAEYERFDFGSSRKVSMGTVGLDLRF